MAYVPQQIPQDEQNKNPTGTGQTTPQPVPPQGGGSAGSGTNAAPGQATSTQFGSNAAKLSDYLSANKDQVQQFGQNIAGNLSKNYGDTMGSIDQGLGNFNQQVGQGYAPANSDLVSKAVANPTEFVKTPENVSGFKSLYNDQYTGPANFESSPIYSNLNDQVNKAVENAGLAGSTSGLQSYLNNNNYGTANNMPGVQALDTALLQRSPEARSTIQAATVPYQNLNSYLSGKATEGNASVANAQKSAADTAQAVQNQFTGQGGVIPNFQNDLQGRVSALSGQQNNLNSLYQNVYGGGVPTLEQLTQLGVSPEQANQLLANSGILSDEYSPFTQGGTYATFQGGNPASLENTATADDYAKSQALAQLTGAGPVLDPTKASGAGTASLPQLGYNIQQAMSDVNSTLSTDDKNILQSNPEIVNYVIALANGTSNQNAPQALTQSADPHKLQKTIADALYRTGALKPPTTSSGLPPGSPNGVDFGPLTGTGGNPIVGGGSNGIY